MMKLKSTMKDRKSVNIFRYCWGEKKNVVYVHNITKVSIVLEYQDNKHEDMMAIVMLNLDVHSSLRPRAEG